MFEKRLREVLMRDNPYASHRVDAVIKASYPISESWRKRYLKGRARKVKPKVRRRSLGAGQRL